MTPAMVALQPEEIIVNQKVPDEMEEQSDELKCGPVSPDGVDGLPQMAADDEECESDGESAPESEEEDDDDEEEDEKEQPEEAVEELDAAALLAFSKNRLEKSPQPSPTAASAAAEPTQADDVNEDDTDENEMADEVTDAGDAPRPADESSTAYSPAEEKKMDVDSAAVPKQAAEEDEPAVKDQAYFVELAMKKAKEAEVKAKMDEDPGYLLKLSQKKVEEAEARAKEDEEAMEAHGEHVIKPAISAKPTRSENSELWALLNYSKMRLETGATPTVGKKSGSKNNSVRGDDVSVSSKLSKSSKRSLGSRKSITKAAPIAVVGGPGDLGSPLGVTPKEGEERGDVPFPDVTDDGNESVDGSVSLESETKANEDESDNSDDEDESSDDEEDDEEEDELPDFLKDSNEEHVDPEEAKALYEAAKFKAASILSVSEENLTDVQMLQAIAIAEEAARKGDDKFSTKRSLFKLNEAKIEDLKSFLSLSISSPKNGEPKQEREAVRWGIGKGRLMKKLGSSWQDFREKCSEIDERKQQERAGQMTGSEMLSAAMLDLKAQIDEYEKIVTKKGKPKS